MLLLVCGCHSWMTGLPQNRPRLGTHQVVMATVLRVSGAPGCGMFWSSPLRPMNGGRRSPCIRPLGLQPSPRPGCALQHTRQQLSKAAVANPTHAPEHLQLHNGHTAEVTCPAPFAQDRRHIYHGAGCSAPQGLHAGLLDCPHQPCKLQLLHMCFCICLLVRCNLWP